MRTEDLIGRLSAELRPVRRLGAPWRSAALWAGVAGLVIALAAATFGLRHDLAQRLAEGFELPQMIAALATGLLAAYAAVQLALPDRDRRWALLPIPALVAWIATLGWGCIADFVRLGPEGLRLGTSFGCLGFILTLGTPLTLALLWLVRHAAPIRPRPVAAMAGLAAAALANIGLTLVHHLDAAVMVLIWHGGSVLLAMALSRRLGAAFLRAAGPA